jgi:2-polyprenyl-3-methyl-5-hydroxy-6-metoxy-1,4-benzoquinol methylase
MDSVKYDKILDLLVCPHCKTDLQKDSNGSYKCSGQEHEFKLKDGILSFIDSNDTRWQKWFEQKLHNAADLAEAVAYGKKTNFDLVCNIIKQLTKDVHSAKVLDVGCGHGVMSQHLTEQNTVIGLDFTFGMLKPACERGLLAIHADANAVPLKKQRCNLVMSIEVVQHVDDPLGFAGDLAGFVKPGGKLIISGLSSDSLVRKLNRKIGSLIKRVNTDDLPKLHSGPEIARYISAMGFDVDIWYSCYPMRKIIKCRGGNFGKKALGSNFFIIAQKRSDD